MGSFVAEAGTDVSLGREKVKSSEENSNNLMESSKEGCCGKNPNEELDSQNQKDWGFNAPGEPDYKCNGNNPDLQTYENGDHGDLPSFSMKRLRRLPLRVTTDQLASTVDQNRPEEQVGIEQRQSLPDDAAQSSGDDSKQVQISNQVTNQVGEVTNQVGVQNGEIQDRNSNRELATENRNPDSDGVPGSDQSVEREEQQAGNVIAEDVAASNNSLEEEGGNKVQQSYVSSSNPEDDHTPVEVSSDLSSGMRGASDKDSIKVESPAPVVADPIRDALTDDNEKVREDVDLTKSAELPSPGVVQILPPVMGSRFGSPGETTDEETDSPRSSDGFSYPDSDAMALPYSGHILYPSRFSCAQSSNGPSLLQYSGSMSLRSDSSTTSNRSFAFPILAPPEWNSSPARMAKAHPRRKNRFDCCCFFRSSRSRYKY